MAVARISESILRDEHAVLPISVLPRGEYGLQNLALSLPTVVGHAGVEKVLEIPLSSEEHAALMASADQLHEVIARLSL